ncbi:hypothetical protein PINS_up024591 [Pythium insidiosum]|nr:hypothetical protein PINS_up024591 [Pythium insidiosum]
MVYLISVFHSSFPNVELAVSVFTRAKWLFVFLAIAIVSVGCLRDTVKLVVNRSSKSKTS